MPPPRTSDVSILAGGSQGAASTEKRFAPLYGAVDATILSLGEAAERTGWYARTGCAAATPQMPLHGRA